MSIFDDGIWPPVIVCNIIQDKRNCMILRQLGKADYTLCSSLALDLLDNPDREIAALNLQLADLARLDLITCRQHKSFPHQKEYALAKDGRKLLPVIDISEDIGISLMRKLTDTSL